MAPKRVGVLALQGDFEAHQLALQRAGAVAVPVRTAADLESLTAGHGLGEIFSKATTTQLKRGEHAVYDVSSIGDGEQKLQAAALMLCWVRLHRRLQRTRGRRSGAAPTCSRRTGRAVARSAGRSGTGG